MSEGSGSTELIKLASQMLSKALGVPVGGFYFVSFREVTPPPRDPNQMHTAEVPFRGAILEIGLGHRLFVVRADYRTARMDWHERSLAQPGR